MKNPLVRVFGRKAEQELTKIIYVNIDQIFPSPYQSREDFDDDKILKLGSSIAEHGLIQPLVVSERGKGDYELIAGERRMRACKAIGLEKVPVILKEATEEEKAQMTLVENLQRQDLNFIEEAVGYKKLLDVFGLTQDELAKKIGKSQSTIANKLRVLSLPESVLARLCNSREFLVTERHARALLLLKDETLQHAVLDEVKEKELNVRQTEALVQDVLHREEKEKTKKKDGRLIKIFRDLRLSLNSIKKTVEEIREAGYNVQMEEVEHSEFIEVKIKLGKDGLGGGG